MNDLGHLSAIKNWVKTRNKFFMANEIREMDSEGQGDEIPGFK